MSPVSKGAYVVADVNVTDIDSGEVTRTGLVF